MLCRSLVGTLTFVLFVALVRNSVIADEGFPEPFDTEKAATKPLSPEEAAASWTTPPGFQVTLFAGEPDVRQPIGMTFDDRGRLWVAENYTYAESGVNFDARLRDRIVILEDTDGDHRADRRTVFADQLEHLTSVEIGFGGVWALAAPYLLFIPDRDGDDRPDGEPIVMLEGWNVADVRHNVVNGLRWGPDGWLYGRHGILATSRVGTPETAESARTALNCCIWRFHPTEHRFEVVCQGTTNSWGMDWNEHGELFFINTVIGHLWHAVPGAHFRRMYGEDFNPHTYELIEQTADHVHWDVTTEDWLATRKTLSENTSSTGGGHAHSGLMIYSGHNWPDEYRGDVFMLNFHGRRLNRDHLERSGATYTARHRPDPMKSGDPWFRGIDLACGPDGGVYVLDWSDTGECHDEDGVHRSSGRVFKILHDDGARSLGRSGDLAKLSNRDLAKLQCDGHRLAAQARRLLHERATSGDDMSEANEVLRMRLVSTDEPANYPLRACWGLHAIGRLSDVDLRWMLGHTDEHVRTWGVRFLADRPITDANTRQLLEQLAEHEQSGLVLTYLASALQRLPLAERWTLAAKLAAHQEFADDHVLPLMIWYGVEPAVPVSPAAATELALSAKLPKLSTFIVRRITGELARNPQAADPLVDLLSNTNDAGLRRVILTGMNDALRGWRQAPAPAGWTEFAATLSDTDEDTMSCVRELSAVFGDGRALDELKQAVGDASQPLVQRREALRALVQARVAGLDETLRPLLANRELAVDTVQSLATLDLPGNQELMLSSYPHLNRAAREAVIEALATRVDSANALLDAIAGGTVPAADLGPTALRQLQLMGDAALSARLAKVLPSSRLLSDDKLKQLAQYREQLTPEQLATANLTQGRQLYSQHCGKCHKLFGEGGAIGPELTGAQRGNLDYWLSNVADPSATVGTNYRLSIIALTDGRILNGVVGAKTERTVSIQTASETLVLERSEIEAMEESDLSLMPEGQLNALSADEIRDLVGYLMSDAGAR
jgi:putative membrane-bound dehydrogenase-like protein